MTDCKMCKQIQADIAAYNEEAEKAVIAARLAQVRKTLWFFAIMLLSAMAVAIALLISLRIT